LCCGLRVRLGATRVDDGPEGAHEPALHRCELEPLGGSQIVELLGEEVVAGLVYFAVVEGFLDCGVIDGASGIGRIPPQARKQLQRVGVRYRWRRVGQQGARHRCEQTVSRVWAQRVVVRDGIGDTG
jgi:hypothetical protein